jgi:ribose 1,5-bisphosphokinase
VTLGRLFYLVGASCAGQDGLLDYARRQLGGRHPIMFAHRYVTQSASARTEYDVLLSEAEFALRKRHGLFVMDWESRGIRYGMGNEINYWLAMGLSVVARGSRAYLGDALKAYPDMTLIWLGVASPAQSARDAGDTRLDAESAPAGHPSVPMPANGRRIVHIGSDRSAAVAGEKLVSVLVGHFECGLTE